MTEAMHEAEKELNKETLREKIKEMIDSAEIPNEQGSYDSLNSVSKNTCSVLFGQIMSLLSQSESKEQLSPENENKSNYMSFVNGSATHCNACGKQL